MSKLLVGWATHQATVLACTRYHYSKSVPAGKLVKIGVWEDNVFKGVVIFSYGANNNIGKPYGLVQQEVCELTRIALKNHDAPVSKIVSIALRFLKKYCPGVRLVVSYADKDQGHSGGVYKAGNWVYEGLFNEGTKCAYIIFNKRVHPKTVHSRYGKGSQNLRWLQANVDPNAKEIKTLGKHKYLMPLDENVKSKVELLRKPYPHASKV